RNSFVERATGPATGCAGPRVDPPTTGPTASGHPGEREKKQGRPVSRSAQTWITSVPKRPAYVSRRPPERAEHLPRDKIPVWRKRGTSCTSFRGSAAALTGSAAVSRTL